jgi:hypothetical protein
MAVVPMMSVGFGQNVPGSTGSCWFLSASLGSYESLPPAPPMITYRTPAQFDRT